MCAASHLAAAASSAAASSPSWYVYLARPPSRQSLVPQLSLKNCSILRFMRCPGNVLSSQLSDHNRCLSLSPSYSYSYSLSIVLVSYKDLLLFHSNYNIAVCHLPFADCNRYEAHSEIEFKLLFNLPPALLLLLLLTRLIP